MTYVFDLKDWSEGPEGQEKHFGCFAVYKGRLEEIGLNVPRGFFIGDAACAEFLGSLDLKELDLKELKKKIANVPPKDIGRPDIDDILSDAKIPWRIELDIVSAYKKCFEGRDVPAALIPIFPLPASDKVILHSYSKLDILTGLKLSWLLNSMQCEAGQFPAVAMQEVVDAELSGTAVKKGSDIVVNAAYGMTDLFYETDVQADTYIIDADSIEIKGKEKAVQDHYYTYVKKRVAAKKVTKKKAGSQKMKKPRIEKLAKACLDLFGILGENVKLYWSVKGDDIYFMNAEPLPEEKEEAAEESDESLPADELEEEIIDAVTMPGYFPVTASKVFVTADSPTQIKGVKNLPIEGVCPLSLDGMVVKSIKAHPLSLSDEQRDELLELMVKSIRKAADTVYPKPVVVKLTNLTSEDYLSMEKSKGHEVSEVNPYIGLRGCSRHLSEGFKDIFRLEFRSVRRVRDEGRDNVWIALPFVRTVKDARQCLDIAKEEGLEQGTKFKVFISVEVPMLLFMAEHLMSVCGGLILEMDQLLGLLMGADIRSERLKKMGYLDKKNKGLRDAVAHLIGAVHGEGGTVIVNGSGLVREHELVEHLIRVKADGFCTPPGELETLARLIASIEQKVIMEHLGERPR